MFCPPPRVAPGAARCYTFPRSGDSPPRRRAVIGFGMGKGFQWTTRPGRPASAPSLIGRPERHRRGRRSPYRSSASRRRGRVGCVRSDLCRARSRHQQLPAAGGARDPRRLPRHRCVLAHHPARRGRHRVRPAERGGDRARGRGAAGLPQQDPQPRRHPGAADRDRGLPRGRERHRIPGARARRGRHRARDRRSRDRGAARRDRLHAAGRSGIRAASSCSTSAAARRNWSGSAVRRRPAAARRIPRSRPGSRCRWAS